ncbi:carboxypeptidase-like regulatory domain-containing protein [candidate division KSB1 bacterium]
MKSLIAVLIMTLCILPAALSAQIYSVSGYVIDEKSGETMIGVNALVVGTEKGASTDGNGYFRIIGLSPGKYTIEFSYIGYEKKQTAIEIRDKSMILEEIPMVQQILQQGEVVVTGKRTEIGDYRVETGYKELTPKAIQSIPASRGDVFRALKYLPGIEGIDPFSPLFSARGGETGENLVLLDGVTIYNPYHFVTGAGLFNLYAIKNIEMLVGGFGAEYGGRNSSVLYITTREGNNKELHGEMEASTSQTKAILDFPVGKNATMMVSGRSYYDLISRFLFYMPNYFYDFNTSLNWKINNRNRLSLRYFRSKDFFDYKFSRFSTYFRTSFDTDIFDDYDVAYRSVWNNQAATAILKTIVTPKIYLKTQFSGSFFSSNNDSEIDFEYHDDENDEDIKLYYKTGINNTIRDISGKAVLSVKMNSAQTVNLGGEFTSYNFDNDIQINNFSEGRTSRKPNLFAGFAENILEWHALTLRSGIRTTKFSYANKLYWEPRINAVLQLPNKYSIHGAWGKYYQFINSINSQDYEMSQYLDYYYPLKSRDPSASTHYILGLAKSFSDNSHVSADLYYKDISRVYTFDYTINTLDAFRFTDKLKAGSGKSYGLELLWNGTWNRLSGWVSYGISKSTRSYPHIMEGKTFLFDYDRTHSFKAVLNHQVHPSLSYGGTLVIQSGPPKTLEQSFASYFYYDPRTDETAFNVANIADIKNNIRLPLQIRLDLGLKKQIRKGFGAELAEFLGAGESFVNISFGNLLFLFRRNVWFYIPRENGKYYGVGTNYFPEIGVGYTIKF